MKKRNRSTLLVLLIFTLLLGAIALPASAEEPNRGILKGRIVSVGIPGASAISPVGTFLPGGPIHDNPAFSGYTQPGRILDPVRILVGSTSNFGAPPADPAQPEGSFLSIDPRDADELVIPSDFASAGNQASALGGAVQMYSAQSPGFLNAVNNPGAITAHFTAVSNPLGISINNAFGRLWPANAPHGLGGIGTSTIVDPTGLPLAGAPNIQAGGVFAGDLTPRLPAQLLPGGLTAGAVGTAFLGRSPDGSRRAVFSVVLADGSLVQEHTAQAVDGLASAGTVAPLIRAHFDEDEHHTSPRLGVILNYTPTRILYVSEPLRNSIAVLKLADDSQIFHVANVQRIYSDVLKFPVDLAPAHIETQNPNWASNTTLEEGADFYVANRGNNTIVRMRQDGSVVAVREVRLNDGQPLDGARLNGVATSPDGTKIWVTVTGSLQGEDWPDGAVIELPTFPE